MNRFWSVVGIATVSLAIVGCDGGRRGWCGPKRPLVPCVPTPESKRRDVTASVRFIHAIGQVINGTATTRVPCVNVFVSDQCDRAVERFAKVPWLLNDCSSKYNNCIWYGNRRVLIRTADDNATEYFNQTIRFFKGLATLFAYPNNAAHPTSSSGLLSLSDDQSAGCVTCRALVRAVVLSQRLAVAAGGDVDVYLQATVIGSTPVRVVQGLPSTSADDAVPNWTDFNASGVLTRGTFVWGGIGNGCGLSGYVNNFAPGTYNVIAVTTGSDSTVPANNLLPNARICLRNDTFHTVVISDRNCQETGYGIRVYTDGPCCCPEKCPTPPIFVQPVISPG